MYGAISTDTLCSSYLVSFGLVICFDALSTAGSAGIGLYEAWNKPENVKEWRAKLIQTEAAEE